MHPVDQPEGFVMKTVLYRRLPDRQPKAVAIARTAPNVPALALAAAGALALIFSLALRGLL